MNKRQQLKEVREIIGDNYFDDERRGAKTNEFGMTKSQVISLADDLVTYFNTDPPKKPIKILPGQLDIEEQLVECPLSERVDGKIHSWKFDGDDPRIICVYCGRVQDSISGQVITEGRRG